MWKSRKDDDRTLNPPAPAAPAPANIGYSPTLKESLPVETPKIYSSEVAHIGKSVFIKGELSGSEDLYLDGEVEGSIQLKDHSLIVGPHGRVRANIQARDVVVHGKVDGNIRGTERVELKKSAVLVGDISTQRIIVEDGAFFKGAVDIQKDAKAEPKREMAMAAAASFSPTGSSSTSTGSAGSSQPSLVEKKY